MHRSIIIKLNYLFYNRTCTAFASEIACRSRMLVSGSPPPVLAAIMIALESLLHSFPRLLSIAAFLCLMPAQCEWPAMSYEFPFVVF